MQAFMKLRNILWTLLLPSVIWLTAGCKSIDDDLSDCQEGKQFKMGYQLKLVTNMTTELQTQLTTITELSVAGALETHLQNIFSDFAHDVDLSFYDTEGELKRLQHDQHIMDANQTSYTLTLPMRKYMHLAVANIADNNVMSLINDEYSNSSMLRQADGRVSSGSPAGIVASHTTGLFTARQPMEVLEGIDQTFNVRLYMANSAATLVLDPKEESYTDIKVYATGFASAFYISDSTYVHTSNPPLIEAKPVATGNNLLCFCSVNFPSRDAAPAAAGRRTDGTPLWQFKVYVTKTDGSVTETILDIDEPLKAGDLKVIKGSLDDDGAVRPTDATVGVSVVLDWGGGGSYDEEL